MDSLGVQRIPLLILTHYHADHVGGAEAVIERYRPSLVLVRAGAAPPWLYEAAATVGAEVRSAAPGERLTVGAAAWHTASAWEPPGAVVPDLSWTSRAGFMRS